MSGHWPTTKKDEMKAAREEYTAAVEEAVNTMQTAATALSSLTAAQEKAREALMRYHDLSPVAPPADLEQIRPVLGEELYAKLRFAIGTFPEEPS